MKGDFSQNFHKQMSKLFVFVKKISNIHDLMSDPFFVWANPEMDSLQCPNV